MGTKHPSRSDSGLATVEFAIVGSLLIMLMIAIAVMGLLWGAKQQVAGAANAAARAAAVHQAFMPAVGSNITISPAITPTSCAVGSFASFDLTATKAVSPPPIPFVSGALPTSVSQTVRVQCIG
jgi:hypothetical protein